MGIKPRIKLKASKRSKLTPGLVTCLELGTDLVGELGTDLSDEQIERKLRELWQEYGDEVTRNFVETHPTERPECWWKFSSPAPRPEIVWRGGSPGGDPWAADRALRRARELEILIQHGLLTDGERKFVSANPSLLLPLDHDLDGD